MNRISTLFLIVLLLSSCSPWKEAAMDWKQTSQEWRVIAETCQASLDIARDRQ